MFPFDKSCVLHGRLICTTDVGGDDNDDGGSRGDGSSLQDDLLRGLYRSAGTRHHRRCHRKSPRPAVRHPRQPLMVHNVYDRMNASFSSNPFRGPLRTEKMSSKSHSFLINYYRTHHISN